MAYLGLPRSDNCNNYPPFAMRGYPCSSLQSAYGSPWFRNAGAAKISGFCSRTDGFFNYGTPGSIRRFPGGILEIKSLCVSKYHLGIWL